MSKRMTISLIVFGLCLSLGALFAAQAQASKEAIPKIAACAGEMWCLKDVTSIALFKTVFYWESLVFAIGMAFVFCFYQIKGRMAKAQGLKEYQNPLLNSFMGWFIPSMITIISLTTLIIVMLTLRPEFQVWINTIQK